MTLPLQKHLRLQAWLQNSLKLLRLLENFCSERTSNRDCYYYTAEEQYRTAALEDIDSAALA